MTKFNDRLLNLKQNNTTDNSNDHFREMGITNEDQLK